MQQLTKEQERLTVLALRTAAERWDGMAMELSRMGEGQLHSHRVAYDALAAQMRQQAKDAREIATLFWYEEFPPR